MTWLPDAHVIDLRNRANGGGNGPFGPGQFLGVVLHCNSATDTPDSFFVNGGGPDSVVPNFQVHADGTIAQYLPLENSPWCQADGNTNYGAIETAGSDQPLNAAQFASVVKIVQAYHAVMGMPLQLAEAPGQRGLGYHAMGGAAWGGHPCPLPARIAQRAQIIAAAGGATTTTEDDLDATQDKRLTEIWQNMSETVTKLRELTDTTLVGDKVLGSIVPSTGGNNLGWTLSGLVSTLKATAQGVSTQLARPAAQPVDVQALAAALKPELVAAVQAAGSGATADQIVEAFAKRMAVAA